MFKLISKILSFIIFIILVVVALAVWKGGEPFRWLGRKTAEAGRIIESFGELVVEMKAGKKKASEKLIEIKGSFDSIQKDKKGQEEENKKPENEDGTTDKR